MLIEFKACLQPPIGAFSTNPRNVDLRLHVFEKNALTRRSHYDLPYTVDSNP